MTGKIIISETNVMIWPNKSRPIYVAKLTMPEVYQQIRQLMDLDKNDEIFKMYGNLKEQIEKYTNNKFTTNDMGSEVKDKETGEVIPSMIVSRLKEMKNDGMNFMPLLRFWNKLKKNPDEGKELYNLSVKKQLYDFIIKNKMPIDEYGNIICEKGVSIQANGKLVDKHTLTFDNSIGMTVVMNRRDVECNPSQDCMPGLHVGVTGFVRRSYSTSWSNSNVIIRVSVNPEHVVSVPSGYNGEKMRVCEYTVIGFAEKDTRNKPVVDLGSIVDIDAEEFPTETTEKAAKVIKKQKKKDKNTGKDLNLSLRFHISIGKGKGSYKILFTYNTKPAALKKFNSVKLLKNEKKRLLDQTTGEKILKKFD